MGEILYSIAVGGFLVISGIAMYIVLTREEHGLFGKKEAEEKERRK